MTKKPKARKVDKKKEVPQTDEAGGTSETAPQAETLWKVQITHDDMSDSYDKRWLVCKSFMLKQQELLEQLQTDFGFWLRAFVNEVGRAKEDE